MHRGPPPTSVILAATRPNRPAGNILVDDDGRIVHIDFGFLLSNSPGGVNFESAPFKLTRELLEVMDSNSDGKRSEMFDYYKVRPRSRAACPLAPAAGPSSGPAPFSGNRSRTAGVTRRRNRSTADPHQVLMILGFLAVRTHSERILLLVKTMARSGFPCFKAGDRAVKALEKRLQVRPIWLLAAAEDRRGGCCTRAWPPPGLLASCVHLRPCSSQLPLSDAQCVMHVVQLIAESLDAWRTRQYDYYQRVLNGIL